MSFELLEIGDVKDGEQILAVEFRCGCSHLFDIIPTENIDGRRMGEISQNQCPSCGKYSGFNLGDKRGTTVEKLNQLRDVLTVNLKQPMTSETKRIIQVLMDPDIPNERRNLKLRFKIKREA